MKLVADTNWLISAYFEDISQARTGLIERFVERNDAPWIVPPTALLECRNIFAHLARAANGQAWKTFQSQLGTKLLVPDIPWNEIQLKTEELCDRFSPKARVGTADLIILATALKLEATHFLSFDINSNTRALAAALKLKVYPDLTADDKQRLAMFR